MENRGRGKKRILSATPRAQVSSRVHFSEQAAVNVTQRAAKVTE